VELGEGMMHEIEVKCPRKKCKGYAQASVSYEEGNTEGPCDTCDAQVGFHFVIEIDGIHEVNE